MVIEGDCDMMSLTGASGSITGNAFGITPSGLDHEKPASIQGHFFLQDLPNSSLSISLHRLISGRVQARLSPAVWADQGRGPSGCPSARP